MIKTIFISFMLLVAPLFLLADTVSPDCDTLFTNDGKVYFVHIYDVNNKQVEFSTCDAPDEERFTLSMSKIKRVGLNPQGEYKHLTEKTKDPLVRLSKRASLQSIIGAVGVYLLSIFGIPALVFLILGIVNGERALRKLEEQKDHPQASLIRKRSRTAVMVGMFSLIIPIAVYLLLSLVL